MKMEPNKKQLFKTKFPDGVIDEKVTWTNYVNYISAEITKVVRYWSEHDFSQIKNSFYLHSLRQSAHFACGD